MDHYKDLAPLFAEPCGEVEITEPDEFPPLSKDEKTYVTRDNRKYIAWKHECEQYNERTLALEANEGRLFTVIIQQCSQPVEMKLEASEGYEDAVEASNCTWLLTTLKNICHKFEHTENRYVALVNAKVALLTYRQSPTQTVTEYYEAFKELLSVLESYGGKVHDPEGAAPPSANIKNITTAASRDAYMRNRYCAVLFIRNADRARFESLRVDLSNDFGRGRDEYPASLVDAQQMLLSYKPRESTMARNNNQGGRGGRNQDGRTDAGRGDRTGRGGRSGRSFAQVGLLLAQVENHFPSGIPDHFVLLDSDSTVSIFCNRNLLTDIHDVDEPLHLETNGGGYQVSTQMGTVPNIGKVWFNPDSIANVLSLAQVRRVRRVTLDTAAQAAFHVHKLDGSGTTVFAEHESGLYLHDASITQEAGDNGTTNPAIVSYSCLQTVAEIKDLYTKRQVEAADGARKLYRLMGRPGMARFLEALKESHILNCPITVDDAKRAEHIYGKDVAFLKGKTTARAPKDHVADVALIALPPELLSLHPKVTLCFDLFYVLGMGFSLSTSRDIRYLSCQAVPDRSKATLEATISADLKLYRDRGFTPCEIHATGEYAALQQAYEGVRFTICSADDHVPEIERAIRTVKESIRAAIHGMPFARLPRVMVRELAALAVRTINMLPSSNGISGTMSPATIVTGQPKADYNTMQLEFGGYVQVYDGTSNDTKSRTMGAIVLNPTGNSSGDYYFMSLATGKRVHRRSWTTLPISDLAISRVEAIALQEKMPAIDHDNMISEYDPDGTVDETAYDKNYTPPFRRRPDIGP